MDGVTVQYDFHHDEAVLAPGARENQGFLLTRTGSIGSPTFYAHYVDGLVETINPPGGFPRPDPDPAVRTKKVVLPTSLRAGVPEDYKHGSRYSGQIRRAVQCAYSRGLETKFAYGWTKTHGLLEYPRPRQVGATAALEQIAAALRHFWLIEVSSAGVFAAPLKVGLTCIKCATNLSSYQPTAAQLALNPGWSIYQSEISLAWAYANRNEGGAVQRLLTAVEIAPAYVHGSPWYEAMGWAFSYSGHEAANVVAKSITDGLDFSTFADYYETRLMTLAFSVAFAGVAATIEIVSPGVAEVTRVAHGITEGALAVVTGATQPEYNGAHVVIAPVTADTFRFNVTGSPSSPALGDVQIANAADSGIVSAALTVGASGQVTFKRVGGTLWVPSDELNLWDGVFPFANSINGDGPVHVFYDGDQQVLTRWSRAGSSVPQVISGHPEDANGMVGSTGGTVTIHAAQFGAVCEKIFTISAYGSYDVVYAHSTETYGFYDTTGADFRGATYSYRHFTASTSLIGGAADQNIDYFNAYSICPADNPLGFGIGRAIIRDINSYQWARTTETDGTEVSNATSVLVLFPTEREAALGIKIQAGSFSGRQSVRADCPVKIKFQELRLKANDGPDTQPFTNFDYEPFQSNNGFRSNCAAIGLTEPAIPAASTVNTSSSSGSFQLRASGGLILIGAVDASLSDFLTWTKGSHEQASSSLFFMRGALYYSDPNLSPANEKANRFQTLNSVGAAFGGFAGLTGKTIEAFVGQV